MEPHELIAKLEALGLEQDALTVQLIEALKEREAIKGDIEQLELRRLEQQGAASSLVVEAAFALQDIGGSKRRKALLRRMGFGAVQ
ncbi:MULTISPECIES: hypothetical protein [unclassified Rhizobium]|uniref:hypothetical protein n=1 Tax=unclassified Rhizobium TaxID=2613769 RepID=UPI001616B57D|nr:MULTISPECIES: hypothetical protein [unclassified Rhizobium]MBB3386019.1 hypothetical protein [Rhizobium sp. BK098]MBB3617804.1 hypothetical protein [Rhizobium sp. BK609]MBB3683381.1 hypothetical protein [Rhizobium sp. BK612]